MKAKRALLLIIGVAMMAVAPLMLHAQGTQWTLEKAKAWYDKQPWIVGVDYVPSTAVNQIEMWQATTFDLPTIDREMKYAHNLGFNTIRVFLSRLVYNADAQGYKKRIDQFLSVCQKHDIKVIITFWTNGGKCKNPQLGVQPDPEPGIHNPGWCMVPGTDYVNNSSKWPELKKMVQDIIGTFKDDKRVLMWDLYNEPENLQRGVISSVPLLRATFKWAREVVPSQPLTAPLWSWVGNNITSLPEVTFALENSDIITFHAYDTPESLERYMRQLLPYGRPMICTEFLARTMNSTFQGSYPVFKKYGVGAISFGLVVGKCGFHYVWNKHDANGKDIPWKEQPKVWFHDILYANGQPYDAQEVEYIKEQTGATKVNKNHN